MSSLNKYEEITCDFQGWPHLSHLHVKGRFSQHFGWRRNNLGTLEPSKAPWAIGRIFFIFSVGPRKLRNRRLNRREHLQIQASNAQTTSSRSVLMQTLVKVSASSSGAKEKAQLPLSDT